MAERTGTPHGLTAMERFMRFVVVDERTGCWEWTGSKTDEGYARFSPRESRAYAAARWIYEQTRGAVATELQMDHYVCNNRGCVNPEHVRPVTARENALRSGNPAAWNAAKTHCVHGHEFTPENTKLNSGGHGRDCRTCAIERQRAYRQRQREALRGR